MKQEQAHIIESRDSELYSLAYLRTISEDNEDFIFESLHIFKFSVAVKIIELKTAAIKGNNKKAAEIAHNIKPSFQMLSINYAREIVMILTLENRQKL